MTKVYLFDWGDTLMVDLEHQQGKMCDWAEVEAVDGALEALAAIAQHSAVYVATNAADSSEDEIKSAFERVGLARYISGYFCKANLGIGKGSVEFFNRIIQQLEVKPSEVTMVGDNFNNDIAPAIAAGIQAIWFNKNDESAPTASAQAVSQIRSLQELCLK